MIEVTTKKRSLIPFPLILSVKKNVDFEGLCIREGLGLGLPLSPGLGLGLGLMDDNINHSLKHFSLSHESFPLNCSQF